MLVVGIDPGIALTGFGFVKEEENGNLTIVDYGVIQTPPSLAIEKRLQCIHAHLITLFEQYRPNSGAVEKLFFQRNVTTAFSVGQARGAALLALAQSNITLAEYTPLEVKLAVVGYGNASKSQVQQMVMALLNLSKIPKPDDAADALAIAICHLHSYSFYKHLEEDSSR